MTNRLAILLASAFLAASPAAAAPAATAVATAPATKLDINFIGVETRTGSIMIALFDSEDAYNGKGAPVRATAVPVKDGALNAVIAGLAPGRYAIKAFHDVDGDGKMGVNPFGMPIEPFAFSNNAKGNRGPAVWADAAFTVAPGGTVQAITIQ